MEETVIAKREQVENSFYNQRTFNRTSHILLSIPVVYSIFVAHTPAATKSLQQYVKLQRV